MNPGQIEPDLFRHIMRNVPAAVAIVTYGNGEMRFGLTATAICSVSASPPQILACINRKSSSHDVLVESGRFAVNFLGDEQTDLAQSFSGAVPAGERFTRGNWRTLASGSPALTDAIAMFDCATVRTIQADTHTIFLGRVVEARAAQGKPLLYKAGSYSTLVSSPADQQGL